MEKSGSKVMSRWLVAAGAVLLMLCLGSIYSWSVFAAALKAAPYNFTVTQTQTIFSVGLLTFALVMIGAGRWQQKAGPTKGAVTGAILLAVGYALASLFPGNFAWLILTIGVIGGAGIGFAYITPVPVVAKWFPDKLGLATGIVMAGFGGGAFVISNFSNGWFAKLIAIFGMGTTFLIWGAVFAIAGIAGALLVRNPPEGWKPAGWEPKKSKAILSETGEEWETSEMAKTPQFWMLWAMFVFGATAGLLVIGVVSPFGKASSALWNVDAASVTAITSMTVGLLAIFNAAGRIVWGAVSDKLGRTPTMVVTFALQGIMMLLLGFANLGSGIVSYVAAMCWVGFMFGANFVLFPAATRAFFGLRNYGINYPIVFTAYGIAGVVGPLLLIMAQVDKTGHYAWAFVPSGILCIVAALMAMMVKAPKKAAQ